MLNDRHNATLSFSIPPRPPSVATRTHSQAHDRLTTTMSGGVVRTSNTRRHARNNNASPYSRPSSKKSSVRAPINRHGQTYWFSILMWLRSQGWSLTGLLSYINPFSSRPEEERAAPEGDAAMRLAARGQEVCGSPSIQVMFCPSCVPRSSSKWTPCLFLPPNTSRHHIPNHLKPLFNHHLRPLMANRERLLVATTHKNPLRPI